MLIYVFEGFVSCLFYLLSCIIISILLRYMFGVHPGIESVQALKIQNGFGLKCIYLFSVVQSIHCRELMGALTWVIDSTEMV